jgi:hypothetical protein
VVVRLHQLVLLILVARSLLLIFVGGAF